MSCEHCKYQYKNADEEPCVQCMYAYTSEFKPMTNADYIVNQTYEELADFLYDHFTCKADGGNCPVKGCKGANCKKHIMKWLQAERKIE